MNELLLLTRSISEVDGDELAAAILLFGFILLTILAGIKIYQVGTATCYPFEKKRKRKRDKKDNE